MFYFDIINVEIIMLGLLKSEFEAIPKKDGNWNHCIDYFYVDLSGNRIDQNSESAEKAHWEMIKQKRIANETV